MPFADLALARRLESTEGHAAVQFAVSRGKLFPESGACWMECAGACVVFDGIDSPVTQTFGLGLFEELTHGDLDKIESFFLDRGALVLHEISPLVGVAAVDLLCARRYRPLEISSVLYRPVADAAPSEIRVRVTGPEQAKLWAEVSARGWGHGQVEFGAIAAAREESPCFLAELDSQPGAAASLSIHDGVALFAGAATVPEMRRRGLQAALLQERMRYAFAHGCDLAMIVAEAGGESQRNAERQGFRIAYTRTKWRLGSGHNARS